MTLIQNPSFSFTLPTETEDDLVGQKCYMKADMGAYLADEIVEVVSYNTSSKKYILGKLSTQTNQFEVGGNALENGTASKAGLLATLDNWLVVNTGTITENKDLLSQLALQNDGKIQLNETSSDANFEMRITSVPFEENENYRITATLGSSDDINFMLDEEVVSNLVEAKTFNNITDGFSFRTDETEPSRIRIRLEADESLEFFQITKQANTMSIKSDGSHKFGIEDSPITIDGDTFVAEAMSFNKTGSRADIDDSNGLPLGSTIIPGRVEGSATLQLDGVNAPAVGDEFVLTGGHYAGTYIIQDIGETQSQGDYTKIAVNFYLKLNP